MAEKQDTFSHVQKKYYLQYLKPSVFTSSFFFFLFFFFHNKAFEHLPPKYFQLLHLRNYFLDDITKPSYIFNPSSPKSYFDLYDIPLSLLQHLKP